MRPEKNRLHDPKRTITDGPASRSVKLAEAEDSILEGDLLLWRRSGTSGRLIAAGSRSFYSHAAMVGVIYDEFAVMEICEWYGGRTITLPEAVRQAPGRIDHYTFTPQLNDVRRESQFFVAMQRRGLVAAAMFAKSGRPYNYAGVLTIAALRTRLAQYLMTWLPAARRFDLVDGGNGSRLPEFCSQAVSSAYRLGAGVDVVPNLADAFTEPGDLSHSTLLKFKQTLVP